MIFFAIIGAVVCFLLLMFVLEVVIRFCLRLALALIMVRQWKREEQR